MRRVVGLAAAILLSADVAAAQAPQDYRALFDVLVTTVSENYYDPRFNGADWPSVTDRYATRLSETTSDAQFLALGNEMLAELGSSHVNLRTPGSGASRGVAARVAMIDGRRVVTEIDPVSAAPQAGLRVGDVILNPDVMVGPATAPAEIEVERCDGSRRTLTVPRESAFWPPREPSFSWSILRRGDGRSVGYLRVDGFDDDGAPLADAALKTLGSTDGLVIDIRRNDGGNASALRLLSYFADPAPAMILLARPFLDTLDGPVEAGDLADLHRVAGAYTSEAVFAAFSEGRGGVALMTEDLGDKRYRKPVVVLLGEDSASAAEGFAWGMRLLTDATVVGRESAGALLSADRFDLIQGWSVRLPVHGLWGPDGQSYGDRAVPPHVIVPLSREALCQGRDLDLERGVEVLVRRWEAGPSSPATPAL